MRDCWHILGIAPTSDLAEIKRVYRDLVKQYHPDRAITPERKRKNTVICARINQAYKQAIHQAVALSDPIDGSAIGTAEYQEHFHYASTSRTLSRIFRSRAVLWGILLFFLALQILGSITGSIEGIPGPITAILATFVFLFVAFFIYGIIFAGTLDVFIIWLFPRRLISNLGLENYENKLIWIMVLVINVVIFFYTDLITAPTIHDLTISIADGLLRVIGAGTVPGLLAINWLKELIQYKNVRGFVGQLPSE